MRISILAAAAAMLALSVAAVAHADDEFNGSAGAQGNTASLNAQAANSELADPTAASSIRSHGQQ